MQLPRWRWTVPQGLVGRRQMRMMTVRQPVAEVAVVGLVALRAALERISHARTAEGLSCLQPPQPSP